MNSKESEATMKRNIRVLLTLMGMVWATVSFAQTPTVTYEYDDCGNRIERIIGFKKVEENGRSLSTFTGLLKRNAVFHTGCALHRRRICHRESTSEKPN